MKPIVFLVLVLAILFCVPAQVDASHGRLGSRVGAVLRVGARVTARPLARVRARRES